MMTGRGRPFTKTLVRVSENAESRSRTKDDEVTGRQTQCACAAVVSSTRKQLGAWKWRKKEYSHISQPREFLLILPIQRCQLLPLLLCTLLQLCLLFSALLALDFLLAEPWVRAQNV